MKKREAFLDKMRVAATCAVVLLHTVTGVMDNTDMEPYPTEHKVFLAAMDLICWCVPVFLMISGYLFLRPDRNICLRDMLTKYCRRIVLALFLFGVPYACLEQMLTQRRFRLGMVGEAFLMVLRGESWSHMWYLYLILALYLLTPLLKRVLAHVPLGAVYGLQGLLLLGFCILPYLARIYGWAGIAALPDWGIYFFYYICGYLFAVRGFRLSGAAWLGRGLPVLAAALAAGMAASRIVWGYGLRMAYNYPFTVLLSLLLFGWGVSTEQNTEQKPRTGQSPGGFRFWERAAEWSFTVYLIHPVFLNAAYKFFHVTPLSFSIGVSLPAFFLGTLLLSAAGAWVLNGIVLLRKYVL